MEIVTPEYDLGKIPQQAEFIFSPAVFPSYFGGFNNGKTFALCARAWIHSLAYPNNRGALCRNLASELRQTTRTQFFEIVGCNETTISSHPEVARWNASENFLRLKNGSEILFRHLSDEGSLASLLSLNLRWAGLDQAEEIPEAAFLTLISRIGRLDFDPRTGKRLPPEWIGTAGNPAGHNWIWKNWKKNGGLSEDYHLVEATTMDNPFASPSYIKRMFDNYSDYWIQRYVYGNWDSFQGQVYSDFDANIHVIDPIPIPDSWKSGIGVDLGLNHPTAFIWCAVDYDGNWYIYDEHVAREKLPEEHAKIIKAKGILDGSGSMLPFFAPHDAQNRDRISGQNYQQAYLEHGINLQVGNRMAAAIGIQKIMSMMKVDPEKTHPYTKKLGCPRLFITRNCEHIIEELNLYMWKALRPGQEETREQPDEVLKVNDDALDAFRYWAMGWTSGSTPTRKPDIPSQDVASHDFIKAQIKKWIKKAKRRAA